MKFAHSLFLLSLLVSSASAQLQPIDFEPNVLEQRTQNEAFDDGLAGWESVGTVEVIPWNQLPPDPIGSFIGSNQLYLTQAADVFFQEVPGDLIKLTGSSAVWQYSPINGKSRYQLIVCNARKRLVDGASGELGWAGYGVTYYDQNWNEVGFFEKQILDSKLFTPGFPPGYSQSTLGTTIPENAAHAILWLANDGSNTELYADDLALTNLFVGLPLVDRSQPVGERFTQDPSETNLLLNSDFAALLDINDPNPYDSSDESTRQVNSISDAFWQREGSLRAPQRGTFTNGGSAYNGEGAYWQNVQLQPGQQYELVVTYSGGGQFTFGIDMYNSQWQFQAQETIEADGVVNVVFPFGFQASQQKVVFEVPAGAVNASVWAWYGPNNGLSNRLDISQITLRPIANAAQ